MPAPISPSNWMTQTYPSLQGRTLRQIAIPGSHDAGMYVLSRITTVPAPPMYYFATKDFVNTDNTQTQSMDVYGQLNAGTRYLDLRPVRWSVMGASLYLGHFSMVGPLGWQGATGEELDTVLRDIASFVTEVNHDKEIIVVKFSHYINVDSEAGFSLKDFYVLVERVLFYLGDYLFVRPFSAVKLMDVPFETLTAHPLRRVIVVFDTGLPRSLHQPGRGLYSYTDFGNGSADLIVLDSYSNTPDYEVMKRDQIGKFRKFGTTADSLFLLSWTLTKPFPDPNHPGMSVLARRANLALQPVIHNLVEDGIISGARKPNVLMVDYFGARAALVDTCAYLNALPAS